MQNIEVQQPLNNQLIPGPELTNQLVGVLTRFREKQVAFIADVEAMFHQVRVPEDQKELTKIFVVGERRHQKSDQSS